MKYVLKNIIILLFIGIAYFIVGYLAAIPLSNYFGITVRDMMFYEGMIITCVFLWFSIHGNSTKEIEILRAERRNDYFVKSFMENKVLNIGFKSLSVVVGGILMVVYSMIWP